MDRPCYACGSTECFGDCEPDVAEKPWVGLTDEEVSEYFGERWTGYSGYFSCFEEVMKWAEAKLKEKNDG